MSEGDAKTVSIRNLRARQEAQLAAEKVRVQPTTLMQYQSRGRVAVIGVERVMELAARLPGQLQPQVILTSGAEQPGVPVVAVGGRPVEIHGYLGNFTLKLGTPGKPSHECIKADLVWDLGNKPLLPMPMKPPGYICSTTAEEDVSAAVESLSELVGTFQKPKYFAYDASICAHARSGVTACTRCLDSCPAQAITSLGESIDVDPYLCQGGGICATVCPSGALTYRYPPRQDLLERVRTLLRVYREMGGERPVLVLLAEQQAHGGETNAIDALQLDDNMLPVVTEELASSGMEVWLAALAYGASSVALLDQGGSDATVIAALQQQVAIAGEILQGMGYPSGAVALRGVNADGQQPQAAMPALQAATFAAAGGKRQTLFMAIDHLHAQSRQRKPMVNLPAGAPFGAAAIDAARCTLCLSCVSACPGKALQSGRELPQIRFIESSCLQCGICTRLCPEDAVWITPRLLFDSSARSESRLLYEEEPFCCISCGRPFATRSVIEKMQHKLGQHPMFQSSRARDRLLMCEECRVADVVQDADAMGGGIDAHRH
jgi:ferredoxin